MIDRRNFKVDRLFVVALFGATVIYLALLPRSLGWADESYYLFEAKRIRDGEVMYRDFFQFITPLASYLMGALFWLFGTTITTARLTMSAVHGGIVAALYVACRTVGVRRELAVIAPLAFLGLCQPVWPFASPHWFSTLLMMLLLLSLTHDRWRQHPRWALVPGLLNGVLAGVQQQKGVWMMAGTILLLMIDGLIDHFWDGSRARWFEASMVHAEGEPRKSQEENESWGRKVESRAAIVARLRWVLVGILIVVLPLLATLVLTAGTQRIWDALVVFPLDSYRRGHSIEWGGIAPLTDPYAAATIPVILKLAPIAVIVPLLRAGMLLARRERRSELSDLVALVVCALCALLSISYFPDLIHLAFVAPLFFVCIASAGECALKLLRSKAQARRLGWLVSSALAVGLLLQISQNAAASLRDFSIPHDTAFGRVAFSQRWETLLVDEIRSLLDERPSRELFSYPNITAIYLTAGARNPTPFQYLLARVSPPAHVHETLRILRDRRVPYIVASPMILMGRDPMARFIQEHYEPMPIRAIIDAGELPAFTLYRWKGEDGPR